MPRERRGKRLSPASSWEGCVGASPADFFLVPQDIDTLPFEELLDLAATAGAAFYGAIDRESVLRRLRQLTVA